MDDHQLRATVKTLSLEQKVCLLTGGDFWSIRAKPEIGLRRIVLSDGPAGVRGEQWDERYPSTSVPCPAALAASWNEELVHEIGLLLASEARRKGVDVLLAPVLNLQRTPYGGRNFECFGEDPLLAARIGVAYVRGVQSGGIAATAKHFIGNDSETDRKTVDVRIDERTLHEVYLAPFEEVIRTAGVWALMVSYNRVNGTTMTESDLLLDVLHTELGFDGVAMSDWFATRTTESSARAALDLVMPGPDGPWGKALLEAVREGRVDAGAIDDKVTRVLRLGARVGALDSGDGRVPVTADAGQELPSAAEGALGPDPAIGAGQPEVGATLRRAAAAGFVLARNREHLLPLDAASLRSLAVIGQGAAWPRMGGGSATVFPTYTVSPLAGLRAALDGVAGVRHAPGCLPSERLPAAGPPWIETPGGTPGAEVRFLDRAGTVLGRERRLGCAFNWARSLEHGGRLAWVEVRTIIRASEPGVYTVGVSGLGRYRLEVGGEIVFHGRLELSRRSDPIVALTVPPQASHRVALAVGERVEVVLTHEVGSAASELGDIGLAFQLNLLPPHGDDEQELAQAESLAREADAAVVVVGTGEDVECEGFDRASLSLAGRQDELVRRVAAANPNTVVVVNAGAPVLLPWSREVGAILISWFPGQEFGHALADVVLGVSEPGGRLAQTWPSTEDGLPSPQPRDGRVVYAEGLALGYRGQGSADRVAYPFGHGLSYSRWEYVSLRVPEVVEPGTSFEADVTVRNVGPRRSREIVQLYARWPQSRIERPPLWLVGFAAVEADAGQQASARVAVAARALEHWDSQTGSWQAEPGRVELAAGSSSQCLPLTDNVRISAGRGRALQAVPQNHPHEHGRP